jgi:hypothetical protein
LRDILGGNSGGGTARGSASSGGSRTATSDSGDEIDTSNEYAQDAEGGREETAAPEISSLIVVIGTTAAEYKALADFAALTGIGMEVLAVYGLPVLGAVSLGVGIGFTIDYFCGPCRDFGGAVGSRIFDVVHGPYDPNN